MLTLKKTGAMVLVQDSGRFGSQHVGVGPSGPMDWIAHHLVNIAVGNSLGNGAIEIAGDRAEIEFHRDSIASISGRAGIIGKQSIPQNRPFLVREGQTLKFAGGPGPLRSYLGVAGGIVSTPVMGSVSGSTVASLGQYLPGGLPVNSRLQTGVESEWANAWRLWFIQSGKNYPNWSCNPLIAYAGERGLRVRVIREDRNECSDEDWAGLISSPYEISLQSNRMGYRLDGPALTSKSNSVVSRAVVTGAIQLPPSGNPIILLSDRQTVGGYPILGYVASIDLPILARAHPKSFVSFTQIRHSDAQKKYVDLHRLLSFVEISLSKRLPSRFLQDMAV